MLDPKGIEAACAATVLGEDECEKPVHLEPREAETAIRAYLSTVTPAEVGGLVERLNIMAGVMEMGERIAWGSDTSIMREAATALAAKDAELAAERAALRLAADRADRAERALAAKDAELARRDMQLEATAKVALDLSAQLAEKVKALEWVDGEAKTPFGSSYTVHRRADGMYEAVGCGAFVNGPHPDRVSAKEAAQADYERRILSAITTEPATPEGRQEAGRIGDAVLDWMVKFDLLDAGNEYYVSDVLAVLNDLTPSTRPSEQAVTDEMVEAAQDAWEEADNDTGDLDACWRAALKAAMEAGRHD